MELLLRIVGIITPVLVISAIGYVYARLQRPDMTWINRLNTDLLISLLIYTAMVSKDFDIRDFLPLMGGGLLVLAGSGLIAWGAARLLGDTAIPLGLFTVGIGFASFGIKRWSIGIVGAALCPLSGLAVARPLSHLLLLSPPLRGVPLLYAALSPAVMNYVLAERYQQEPRLVSAIVVVGSVASIFFVPLSLYLAF
jgi:predicted permease